MFPSKAFSTTGSSNSNSSSVVVSNNVNSNGNEILTKEKYRELVQAIDKIGNEWFQQLDNCNKDINEIHRLSTIYPSSQQSLGGVLLDIQTKQNSLINQINSLHQMLWNIRHQATSSQFKN